MQPDAYGDSTRRCGVGRGWDNLPSADDNQEMKWNERMEQSRWRATISGRKQIGPWCAEFPKRRGTASHKRRGRGRRRLLLMLVLMLVLMPKSGVAEELVRRRWWRWWWWYWGIFSSLLGVKYSTKEPPIPIPEVYSAEESHVRLGGLRWRPARRFPHVECCEKSRHTPLYFGNTTSAMMIQREYRL